MNIRSSTLSLLAACLVVPGALAAPPDKGDGSPPVVELAYMDVINDSWGEPGAAAVRGMNIGEDGSVYGDASLWKVSNGYYASITWDPGGSWLAWAQFIDRRGTLAIVAGTPGSAPRPVLQFPAGDITRRNGGDTLAWGRGCDGRSVIVFLGDRRWDALHSLFIFDPFAEVPVARLLHVIRRGPDGSPDIGQGIAFSPQGRLLAFVQQDDAGRNQVAALPLTCVTGDPLPVPAGEPQVLFPVLAADGIDGGRGSAGSLDWSRDGSRLVTAISPLLIWKPGTRTWGTSRIAVGELNYSYSAADDTEQASPGDAVMVTVTSGPPEGAADYWDGYPSWGPSGAGAACDRIAFNRSGLLMLMDAPRPGFTPTDCVVASPTTISSKGIAGLDWK